MVSAPAGGAPSPRRTRSLNSNRKKKSPRRGGSAPAVLEPPLKRRRALSAPAVLRGPSPPKPTARRRASVRHRRSSLKAAALGLLALTGGAGGPYVGAPGKAIAVWPLGSSVVHPPTAATVYKYGSLPARLAYNVPRARKPNPSRKLFPGSHALTEMYEPTSAYRARISRKTTMGRGEPIPLPKITASDVRHLENQGLIFPRTVHEQAARGHAILSNKNVPAWVYEPKYRAEAKRILNNWKAPKNRYGVKNQLALPPSVVSKLKALEERARKTVIVGTARAATMPWRVAARARQLPGKVYRSVRASVAKARRSMAKPPN
jgi:hypothetical protein